MTDRDKTAISKQTIIAYNILFAAVAGIVLLAVLKIIEAQLAPRLIGIVFGFLMMLTGNILPKIVDPLQGQSQLGRSQRLIGWTLVLAGAALVVILPFLSNEFGALAGLVIGCGSLALAGALVFRARWGSNTASPTQLPQTRDDIAQASHAALLRRTAFDILHGIAWAFIFLSTATLWGRDGLLLIWIAFAASMVIFPISVRHATSSQH